MRPPPTPADEAERLADLYDYGILDTPAERVFDEIAALAATICGTRYAALTLIDGDRQWFKAAYGPSPRQVARGESVCGHAILERDLFEVADLAEDERFAGNRLVAGPLKIRFYGGSQLTSSRGHNIGMLCVLDQEPRLLDAAQRVALKQLAGVVMAVLEEGRQTRLLSWIGSLLDRVSEEIYILEPRTLSFLYANATALRMLGLTMESLRGRDPLELQKNYEPAKLEGYVRELEAGAPQVVFESTRPGVDGRAHPVEVRWQLQHTSGRPVILSLVQDISRRKEMDRMKDEFISVVNHELRTPLTSIHGAVKLLQQGAGGALPDKANRLVSLAAENTERLRRIVDDILDLDQIASGRMQFRLEPLEARGLLEQVARAYETTARAGGVAVGVDAPEGLRLLADAQRLHQVLANLLSNAIKFAPRDSRVLLGAAEAPPGRVRLEVIDHGTGIPEQFRSRIFQRFAQADMNTRRTKGGSGLGLSIAKEMTQHMGGTIGYTSEPGHTCFFVTMPGAAS